MTAEALITYRCAALQHQAPRPGADHHVTIYKRQWAFCAYDTKAGGHEWEDTGGVALSTLERSTASAVVTPPLERGRAAP